MTAAVDRKNGLKTLAILAIATLAWRLLAVASSGITLYVDEAQYWTWAQHMDWGYFSKPPGIAALIWLSTALFGDGLLGVKALAMACYPLAAVVAWFIARRLYDDKTAFWSALVVLTIPMFGWLGLFVSTDAPLTLCWLLGLWFYLRAVADDRWQDWLLLGAVCGLGLLAKYTMAAFIGAAFLHLAVFHRQRLTTAKPWSAGALALLLLSPNIVWNATHDFPTLKHTADITIEKHNAGGVAPLAAFWGAQWAAMGPVLGSVLLALFVRARESWRDEPTRLLLWFALPLWAIVSAQALKSGANANWAAPAFAPAGIAAAAWLLRRNLKGWLIAGIVINVVALGLAYHLPQLNSLADGNLPMKRSPYARALGWDQLGAELRPILESHPEAVLVADNRTLLAHMLYELRDLHPVAASWNPSGVPSDHYKMTTDLRPYVGRDAILITEYPPGDAFARRFAGMEKLAALEAPVDARGPRRMDVWLLREFKGY